MGLRLAIIASHPIQYFAPWYREIARRQELDLRVFFCCDWGVDEYVDPQFGIPVKWDIPLLDGYDHEFLPITRRPARLNFREVDNPAIHVALDRFQPDVIKVLGYARRTNWRAARWTRQQGKLLLLFSDSNIAIKPPLWKRVAKQVIVRHFYQQVDGALYVGSSNKAYHEQYGMPVERLFPCPLPIDRRRLLAQVSDRGAVRRAVRERYGIPQEAFVVIACGKYAPRKRPLDLVKAVEGAAAGGLPVWGLLVGEGQERGAMEEYCRRRGVRNVVLTGFVNQSQIAEYYAAADALALPSAKDHYPLVISEAASFGLPVIISSHIACLGPQDIARPTVNAIPFTCGDVRALQEAITTLCQNPDLYAKMARAAEEISEAQDALAAAGALTLAVQQLAELGPR